MGTGSRTSLPMIVADELEADWSRVQVVQAPGDEEKYGNQDTDGSRSMRHFIQPMRQCGAAARQMLEAGRGQAAGASPVGEVQAQNHEVVHKASGRKLGYGELAAGGQRAADAAGRPDQAQGRQPPSATSARARPDRRSARHHHRPAIYGIDAKLPGHEIRRRRPAAGVRRQGQVVRCHARRMKVPGVEKVVDDPEGTPPPAKFQPLGGVAVIARNTWAAIKGREALKIDWDDGPNANYDFGGLQGAARGDRAQAGQGRAQRGRRREGARRRPRRSCRPSTTCRTWRTRRWSRRARPPRRRRQVRGLGAACRAPAARATNSPSSSACRRERDGQRHAARRRLRPQVEVRLRARGGAAVARRWAARRSR